ncbi:hypothetical protein DIJ63_13440, partial [Burkholderia pseudomallei]
MRRFADQPICPSPSPICRSASQPIRRARPRGPRLRPAGAPRGRVPPRSRLPYYPSPRPRDG